MTIEAVGENFHSTSFEKARTKAWSLLKALAKTAEEGISEEDLKSLTEYKAKALGLEKWWHPIKIRFGVNTSKSFREPSRPDVTLKKEDLFFLDLGPVFDAHEADVGQTFKLNDENFKNPAEEVFHELKELWFHQGLSGEALYQEACNKANERGLLFNLKMAGHRLSDFPHALHHKGSLKDFEAHPAPQRWILEVHLLEKDHSGGYFFEDIL